MTQADICRPYGLALVAFASGCQVLFGYEEFGGATDEVVAPHPCDGLATAKPDAAELVTLRRVNVPDGSCFWVDETEVTVEQYRRFLTDLERSPGSQIEPSAVECPWKSSFSNPLDADDACATEALELEGSAPFADDTRPIRCVDWCDAEAFCRWAGKSLCTNGFFHTQSQPSDSDEWSQACSDGSSYPYGTILEHERCNAGLSTSECNRLLSKTLCAPATVRSFDCVSPSGALNMIGNVAEWTLSCTVPPLGGEPDAQLPCAARGGGYPADDSSSFATCTHRGTTAERGVPRPDIGLRCCDALDPTEQSEVGGATGR